MGFEVFTTRFRNKETAPYATAIVERIFMRDAIDPTTPLAFVEYADGVAEIYGAEDDMTDGIMIAHFSSRTVLERLFELADETGSLIFWPSEDNCSVVTKAEWLDHLPDDMLQIEPVVVSNVDELMEAMELS